MAIDVPVDVTVSGLAPLEVLDERLDDIAQPRTGTVGLDTTPAMAAAAALDSLLDEATETREADVTVDVNGLSNLDALRASLDLAKERREVAALEEALEDVAKLRRAGVDVEVDGLPQLAALDKALNAVERRRKATVDVDVDGAMRAATRAASNTESIFSSAFQLVARNAVIMAVAVAAAFATLPVAGAAAAAGITLAFGGGLAALGIIAASESKEVRKAFLDMKNDIITEFKKISKPFEDVLLNLTEDIRQAFDFFAPALEVAFKKMAPVLNRFNDDFFKAFGDLSGAIVPITDAFNALLEELGPKMEGFFSKLSESFINLSDVIASDPELFASVFVGILNILPLVINAVATLAESFQVIVEVVGKTVVPAWEGLMDAIEPLTGLLGDSTSGMDVFKGAVIVAASTLALFIRAITITINQTKIIAGAIVAVGRSIARTWNNTLDVTRAVWSAIRASVSRAVNAVRGAIRSGMEAARGVVTSVNNRIRGAFSAAWAAIRGVVAGGVARVRGVVATLSGIVGTVAGVWSRVRGAFSRGISSAVALVRGLPSRVRGAMGNLASTLYSSGVSLISGFARGIRAAIGEAVSAASSAVSAVRSYFPFSPAKKGPFSGSGYTDKSGEALVKDWADAIDKTAAKVSPDIAAALTPAADAFAVPNLSGSPVTSVQGSSGPQAQQFSTDALVAALATLFASLKIDINLGVDRRTTATFWLEGQRLAEVLQ